MKAPYFPRYLLRYTGAMALGLPIGVPNKLSWVDSTGALQPIVDELTLPEMILAGFALTRYCGHGANVEGDDCIAMVEQIRNFAKTK